MADDKKKTLIPDAPAEKSMADSIAEAVTKAMNASLPSLVGAVVMGMEQAKTSVGHEAQMKALKAKQNLEEKCDICRQVVGDGKTRGCGGPWRRDKKTNEFVLDENGARIEDAAQFHDQMVVYPNDPIAIQQFDGVFINGAHYCSSGPDHKVWVPRHNNIAAQLIAFQDDQRNQQIGRKHLRKSGSVGPKGQNVTAPIFQ